MCSICSVQHSYLLDFHVVNTLIKIIVNFNRVLECIILNIM